MLSAVLIDTQIDVHGMSEHWNSHELYGHEPIDRLSPWDEAGY